MVESSNLVFSPVGKLYKTVRTSTVFAESQTQRNSVRSKEDAWPRGQRATLVKVRCWPAAVLGRPKGVEISKIFKKKNP